MRPRRLAVSVTEDSITVTWDASRDNSGRIHAYIVGGIYHPGNSSTKTISWLVPNWTITIHAQAIDPSSNLSGVSAPLTATTARDVTPPTTPANMQVTGTTQSTVSLAWDRSTDRWSFGYEILQDGQVVGSAGGLTFRLRHVTPGSTHTYTVRARDHSGNRSSESNAVTATQPPSSDTTPPSTPTNLTATQPPDDFCGSNILDWDASTDNVDPPSALEYEVNLGGNFFAVVTGDSAFFYSFAGTNTWTVVAVDRSGNSSAASNAATITVQSDQNLC